MDLAAQFRDLTALMEADPAAAADRLDALADRLRVAAAGLRQMATGGMRSQGGAGDRVRMQVVGPDGRVRQTVDTGELN